MEHENPPICPECGTVLSQGESCCQNCILEQEDTKKLSDNDIPIAGDYICTDCHNLGWPSRKKTQGSIYIEIAAWLIFFPIGIAYSIWRSTSKKKICPVCKSESMISVYTLRGHILRKYILQGYTVRGHKLFSQYQNEKQNNSNDIFSLGKKPELIFRCVLCNKIIEPDELPYDKAICPECSGK
jgi:hypothetical protein